MSEFFKTSTTWVVDFRYEGQPRRWFKAFGPSDDVHERMSAELHQLFRDRARLVDSKVRKATEEEETQYLRGEEPRSMLCPTGRRAKSDDRA